MGERTLKKFDVILESKINKLILIIKLVLSTGKIMKTLKINLSNLKLIQRRVQVFPSITIPTEYYQTIYCLFHHEKR